MANLRGESAAVATRGGWPIGKILVALVAIAGLILLGRSAGGHLPQFAAWVDGLGPLGPVVFILAYALAVVAFVPGSLLTLVAGAIFGLLEGTLYVLLAATLGASLAFLVARYLARAAIERRLEGNRKFASIDRAVGQQGRRIVFLLRLSPAFPFNLLNYGLGLTRVRFLDYLVASAGMLPGTLLYVYYGRVAGDVAAIAGGAQTSGGPGSQILLGVGLVATIVVATIVARIARQALTEATSDELAAATEAR
jgi:uncharacterized membrane protein YdjX (TVP38/TMEM64 family)